MIGSRPSVRVLSAAVASFAGLLLLSGCAGAPVESAPDRSRAPSTSTEPAPSPTSSAGEDVLQDAFAERDAFFVEQKFPTDGTPPRATTPAQQELVAKQSEWVKSQGGNWSEQDESLLLAMASDTCETGILNGHRIDGPLLKKTIISSPLLPKNGTPEQRAQLEKNFANLSVFGATYLCPDDGKAWIVAFSEAYED